MAATPTYSNAQLLPMNAAIAAPSQSTAQELYRSTWGGYAPNSYQGEQFQGGLGDGNTGFQSAYDTAYGIAQPAATPAPISSTSAGNITPPIGPLIGTATVPGSSATGSAATGASATGASGATGTASPFVEIPGSTPGSTVTNNGQNTMQQAGPQGPFQSLTSPLTSNATNELNAGNTLLNTQFDPNNTLYNQQLQQEQNQTNVAEAQRGITMSPYGAGVANQANINFNSNWQNQLQQRQLNAIQGAAQAMGPATTLYNSSYGSGTSGYNTQPPPPAQPAQPNPLAFPNTNTGNYGNPAPLGGTVPQTGPTNTGVSNYGDPATTPYTTYSPPTTDSTMNYTPTLSNDYLTTGQINMPTNYQSYTPTLSNDYLTTGQINNPTPPTTSYDPSTGYNINTSAGLGSPSYNPSAGIPDISSVSSSSDANDLLSSWSS